MRPQPEMMTLDPLGIALVSNSIGLTSLSNLMSVSILNKAKSLRKLAYSLSTITSATLYLVPPDDLLIDPT